jgi:hypothetical protein
MANLVTISQQLLQQINSLEDESTVDLWVQVLQAFANVLQGHGNTLRIIQRPVCHNSVAQRLTTFNQSRLTQAARDLDTANTYTAPALGQEYRASGCAGLVASPTGSVTFDGTPAVWNAFRAAAQAQNLAAGTPAYNSLREQHRQQWFDDGGYYGNWHCVAFFIRSCIVRDPLPSHNRHD